MSTIFSFSLLSSPSIIKIPYLPNKEFIIFRVASAKLNSGLYELFNKSIIFDELSFGDIKSVI